MDFKIISSFLLIYIAAFFKETLSFLSFKLHYRYPNSELLSKCSYLIRKYELSLRETNRNRDQNNIIPKLNFDEDYYSVLEVDPSIDQKLLKKSYYRIVFKYHPDNKEGIAEKELCNRQMMVINAAYKVLRNTETRQVYDRKRRITDSSSGNNNNNNNINNNNYNNNNNNSRQYQSKQEQQVVDQVFESPESFFDILSELFTDMRDNNGQTLQRDIEELLFSSLDNENKTTEKEFIDQMSLLTTALKSLKSRLQTLQQSLRVEEALLLQFTTTTTTSSLTDLQESLAKKETVSAIKARIKEVQKQITSLQQQLDKIQVQRLRKSVEIPKQQQQQQQQQHSKQIVENELNKLKEQMKNKYK